MKQVTLIGDKIAKVDATFVFLGAEPECRECRLKSACLQLDKGRKYRVVAVREIHHEDGCRYHENGVRVVEVEAAPVSASLRKAVAIEGSIVEYSRPICSNYECENYDLCHPLGLQGPARVKVQRTSETLSCPLDYNLVRADVEYVR